MVTPEQDCYGRDNSRKFYWHLDGKKYKIGNVCLFIKKKKKQGLCLSVFVDDIKIAGKNHNMALMWKKMMKLVDLGEPTSFLDHVYLGCTKRECKPDEIMIEEFSKMFESRISAGATEKLPGWEKLHAKTVAWSYDMLGHARKCVERYCELASKNVKQLYKVSNLCLDDPQFRQEELESIEELSQVCSQTVLKMLVTGTNRKTRHSMVGQQTCKSSHKMDSGM